MYTATRATTLCLALCALVACRGDGPVEETDTQEVRDTGSKDTGAAPPTEILVPAGSFTMGPSGEQREITLTRAFWVQETEVSQVDWDLLVSNDPSGTPAPDHPVERISWYDALFYANALSVSQGLPECYDLSGCSGTPGVVGVGAAYLCPDRLDFDLDCAGYRLPTEAEWEYAAHLGEGSEEPECTGDADPDVIYCGGSDYTTHAVTEGDLSTLGLYGMQSNVGEWVWDWFDTYRGETTDPLGASSGTLRASRGGGWRFNAARCRVTHRTSEYPSCQNDSLGLRLVRTED